MSEWIWLIVMGGAIVLLLSLWLIHFFLRRRSDLDSKAQAQAAVAKASQILQQAMKNACAESLDEADTALDEAMLAVKKYKRTKKI